MSPARLLPCLAAAAVTSAGGCAPYPLHARMSDAEIRDTVAAAIPAGTDLDQAQTRLTELRVSERHRRVYPATADRPEVLLARLFEAGGFHVDMDDDLVQWVDVSFVFAPGGGLERVLLFRDGVRYFHGEPVSRPKREPMGPVRRYPIAPPPPVDPLEGAA